MHRHAAGVQHRAATDRGHVLDEHPPVSLPAGSRLSVLVRETAAVASATRTVYGGAGLTANYSDAGTTFTTGTLQ